MQWLSSTGGPLILLPVSLRQRWGGALGDASHYRLACATTGYAGIISLSGSDLLLLGDEPMDTTVYRDVNGVVLVRWIQGASREHVESRLTLLLAQPSKELERTRLVVREECMFLMDSPDAGAEAKGQPVRLTSGTYQVIVEEYRDKDTWLLFYRLARTAE